MGDYKPADYVTYYFIDDGTIPNNAQLPLVLYPIALNNEQYPMDDRFLKEGWGDTWIGGVFSYHHFHSTAHEVLGVLSGEATIQFGGKKGKAIHVKAGDVVTIPAGVGHKCLDSTDEFRVVGAYPEGQKKDLREGKASERAKVLNNINHVSLPNTDPVFGKEGTLLTLWK
ncbi:cupin domain-containing protein [Pontibacillus yanchengensis]|uniref:Cupin domain-containing protein n=1 Tax=Pontibacillus yanchengensis TaxID=462910 RepID=A0A6I5A0H6_9BACI|nr:cupin domain-containing protein [Pontibacillus yanchengensis]MYL34836.1 cupin domain-containing protein [Pontibacillus yanchengensis]